MFSSQPLRGWQRFETRGRTVVHILVGTDGSQDADRAVEFAVKLCKQVKAPLRIVHVVTVDDPPLEAHNDHASIAQRRAEALGAEDIDSEAVAGNDIAECLMETARRNNVGLIIVGKRGLTRLSGLLLGSVSQKLISAAPCPVTVV
jgi:nucleotide-binding universal stress UspA family protein